MIGPALLDFAQALAERIEERFGQPAAWAFAFAVCVGVPVAAVAIAIWWYLG
ncbi:hypothetical protein ABS767_03045 [Sphingomonas sp. ST-64]|uniref:Uncharacterized protein n=1 Tax=Sphingomonas plantiphila TaxID=3163295 RepID=A0ABW8YKZ4_9SPHN